MELQRAFRSACTLRRQRRATILHPTRPFVSKNQQRMISDRTSSSSSTSTIDQQPRPNPSLPLPPHMDPERIARRKKYRQGKARPGNRRTPFQQQLMDNPYGAHSSPEKEEGRSNETRRDERSEFKPSASAGDAYTNLRHHPGSNPKGVPHRF